MAAQRDTPVSRLVVNDAGPLIEPAALARIRDYVGPRAHLRHVRRGRRVHPRRVGALRRAHRRAVGSPDAHERRAKRGRALRADLRSRHRRAVPQHGRAAGPVAASGTRSAVPTLVLRGAQSDLLSAATAQEMTQRGPKPARDRIPGRRPCADAALARPVRTGRRVPARRPDVTATLARIALRAIGALARFAYNRSLQSPTP